MQATIPVPIAAECRPLELRMSIEQQGTLEAAAAESGQSLPTFVLERAIDAALGARSGPSDAGSADAGPSERRWRSFCAMLDQL